jgi:hypothetical protein
MDITNIKENIGSVDRFIRSIAAVIFVAAFFNGLTSGVPGILSLAVAVIFLTTAIFGICPLYSLIGLSTKWKHSRH